MSFLYGELLALIAASFAVGCALTRTAVRVLVRPTQAAGTDIPFSDPDVTPPGVFG